MRNETILGWVIVFIMLCAFGAIMYYLGEHAGLSYSPYELTFSAISVVRQILGR